MYIKSFSSTRANPWSAEFFIKTFETKVFFQFEIIITGLAGSFWFIWIPMLWVYGHYKYFYSYSEGIDFRCLTFWWLKLIPTLEGLISTVTDLLWFEWSHWWILLSRFPSQQKLKLKPFALHLTSCKQIKLLNCQVFPTNWIMGYNYAYYSREDSTINHYCINVSGTQRQKPFHITLQF